MGKCSGNCGACTGCARELVLSPEEMEILRRLAEVAFLPAARQMGDITPVDPEEPTEEKSLLLQILEKKGLISLEYDKPLAGFDGYGEYPLKGSMGLTQRGQQVLEIIEYQGIQTEQ